MTPMVVDEREASRLTGIAVPTLQKYRVHGTGPKFVKLGRSVRYRVSDLEAYVAERVVSSTSEAA